MVKKEDKAKDKKEEKPKKTVKKETAKKETKKKAAPAKSKSKNKLKGSETKHSKKYRDVEKLIDREKDYGIDEAIDLAKKTSTTKFDSSIEVHIRLGIDLSKSDQQVRGIVALPHGSGKNIRVWAVCTPALEKEAKEAGAEKVGDELVKEIEKGNLDFDVLVASPDKMGLLGKVAKVLGPKGLMPNPKTETVTQDVGKVIKKIKKGQVEFRNDATGIVHNSIGKVSFDNDKLRENYDDFLEAVRKSKPDSTKGTFLGSIYLTTTMGPSVKVKA